MEKYSPNQHSVSSAILPAELEDLAEELAEHVHDCWAKRRLNEGWTYGPKRDDAHKRHPGLVRYAELSEGEKDYDRQTAFETLRFVVSRGYSISAAGCPQALASQSQIFDKI